MESSRKFINGVPYDRMLVRWAHPKDITRMLEEDPNFTITVSRKCLCIAWLRGSCPNGAHCYLLHIHPANIVNAVLVLLQAKFLAGSMNEWYLNSTKTFTPRHPSIPSGQSLCIQFMNGTCRKRGSECPYLHAAPRSLSAIIEPAGSPYGPRPPAQNSHEGVTVHTLAPPEQSVNDSEEDSASAIELPCRKPEAPPSPAPMPTLYDESSASSSDPSGSETSDSEAFHTPGHSPISTAAFLTLEDANQVSLNIPSADIREGICRDFYRAGRCTRGAQCRWKHERPPPHELIALLARVSLPKPPRSLVHPLPSRPASTPSQERSTPAVLPPAACSQTDLPAPKSIVAQPSVVIPSPSFLHGAAIPPDHRHSSTRCSHPLHPSDRQQGAPLRHSARDFLDVRPSPLRRVSAADVCREWLQHGYCKTYPCNFVHAPPDPEPARLAPSPRPSENSHLEGVSRLHPRGYPLANSVTRAGLVPPHSVLPASTKVASSSQPPLLGLPHAQGPRFSQPPTTSTPSRRRAPPGLCDYLFNGQLCPRHPCTFKHVAFANAGPLGVPSGNSGSTIPPQSAPSVVSHAVPAVPSTGEVRNGPPRLKSPSVPPIVNDSQRPTASSRAQLPIRGENPATAISQNTRPGPARSELARHTRPDISQNHANTHVVTTTSTAPVLSLPPSLVCPTRGSSCDALTAPPGLPSPLKPDEEEYSKDGLFTPDQAVPAVKSVASNTDRFLRDNPSLVKSSRSSRPRGPSYPPEMQHTVNDHIKIVLGPGFSLQSVVTQNETRWLVIGNLPHATTQEALTHLIGNYGTVSDVQMPEPSDTEESISVRVQMSAHSEAVAVANGLDGMTALRCEKPLSVRPTLHRAAVKSQVSDSEIRISWKLPTISLYAGFSRLDAAQNAVSIADGYDWDGYWVTASIYDGFPVVGEYNVRFRGLPPDVKHKVVRKRFHCGKGDLNTDKPPPTLRDFGIPQVQARVSEFGPVVDFNVTPGPYKDGIVRAWCRFETSDVAGVARELNGIPQRCLDHRRLSVWRIHSLKYPINRSVYGYIGEEIKQLREATLRFRRGCNLRIFDRDQWQDKVTIEISAEDNKSLQEIKSRLVDIAQGEIIMDGNVPLWDRFFATSFGTDWMNTVRKANPSILIIIRKLQSFIRVIGAPEKRSGVIVAIRDYVSSLRGRPVHTIPLPGSQFGLFMHPALLAAREKHGSDNLWLDIQHRQLCVRGDEAMYKNVQAAVHAAMKAHPRHIAHDRCPVCFDIPTSPVVLSCGDTYCKDCLAGYLAAGAETRQFPLTCFGADGKCKEPIPIVVARDVLPPTQWEQLIAAAFNAHIATKPDDFRFCPTPDCQQVYRPGAKDSVYSCPACLIRICPYCNVEYHEGITCDDRTHKIDSAFDEYVRTHEVKNCPGCKAPIERTEGCNHMTCTRCHTHTCWECMETFNKGVGIYDHMREVHGSIGV